MRKRTLKKLEAAGRRQLKQRERELKLWTRRRDRLQTLIRVMKTNKTMQPQAWVDGQVAYYEKLLKNHLSTKPR